MLTGQTMISCKILIYNLLFQAIDDILSQQICQWTQRHNCICVYSSCVSWIRPKNCVALPRRPVQFLKILEKVFSVQKSIVPTLIFPISDFFPCQIFVVFKHNKMCFKQFFGIYRCLCFIFQWKFKCTLLFPLILDFKIAEIVCE